LLVLVRPRVCDSVWPTNTAIEKHTINPIIILRVDIIHSFLQND
jgi:hypothetical protein